MKKIILYPLAALALLFTSCAKPDIKSDFNISWDDFTWGGVNFYTNSFDKDALSYMNIPDRRYFIYKDPATGTTDSLVTISQTDAVYINPTSGNPSRPGYYYSTYTLELSNYWSYSSNLIFFKGNAHCDHDFKNTLSFIDSNFILFNELTNLPAYWYPFVSSGNQQYSLITSVNIEGKTYTDVHSFFASNGLPASNAGYLATTFWWIKGIGIVKKEIRTYNSVKTSLLVRYG